MSFKNGRRKSDPPPGDSGQRPITWPTMLRRFKDEILMLVDVWAYPEGNAWLLHDDGTIVELNTSETGSRQIGDDVAQTRHSHTRLPLAGPWSIVVGGVSRSDLGRFDNAVRLVSRLVRQHGELESIASVAREGRDEISALEELISIPVASLKPSTTLNYLAQTTMDVTQSAAAILIGQDGSIYSAGTDPELARLSALVSAESKAVIVRAEGSDTSAPFDYVTRRVFEDSVVVAVAGLCGVSISSSQLRRLDHICAHADGLLRLVELAKVGT